MHLYMVIHVIVIPIVDLTLPSNPCITSDSSVVEQQHAGETEYRHHPTRRATLQRQGGASP